MLKIDTLHNRHQAKMLDEIEKIPINTTEIISIIKKAFKLLYKRH
jgi:hypothetical protein